MWIVVDAVVHCSDYTLINKTLISPGARSVEIPQLSPTWSLDIVERKPTHPKLCLHLRSSLHPMTDHHGRSPPLASVGHLIWIIPASDFFMKLSWASVAAELPFFFPSCLTWFPSLLYRWWSVDHSPVNCLHVSLHLCIYFPGISVFNTQWGDLRIYNDISAYLCLFVNEWA